jgi:hypothetical protein
LRRRQSASGGTRAFFAEQQRVEAMLSVLLALVHGSLAQSCLVITGVIDGPLSGGVPKAIKVYATCAVADASVYGLGSANNGGGSGGQEFTFAAGSLPAGTFYYVASEPTQFNAFFGSPPDAVSPMASINGDDAIELFQNGAVVDVFGEIDQSGAGQPWDYLDGWAYRKSSTGPDGSTFVLEHWDFSGPNALNGATTNAGAATPFPVHFKRPRPRRRSPFAPSAGGASGIAGSLHEHPVTRRWPPRTSLAASSWRVRG